MAMTEFEKKMLQEVKGINKELHELNRTLKKEPIKEIKLDTDMMAEAIKKSINGVQITRGW